MKHRIVSVLSVQYIDRPSLHRRYRASTDINSSPDSWFSNLQTIVPEVTRNLSRPSCWAYPDMLEVGRIMKPGQDPSCGQGHPGPINPTPTAKCELDYNWNRANFGKCDGLLAFIQNKQAQVPII